MEIPPVKLEICQSRWIQRYVTAAHALALLAVLSLPVGKVVMPVLVMGLLICWRWYWRKYLLESADGHQQLLFANYSWLLKREGDAIPVYLHSATVWRWLIVMNFRCVNSRRRHVIVLLPDTLERQPLRRLRVLLRYLPVYSGPGSDA